MVMAYIIFVNPAILSFLGIKGLEGQGLPFAPTLAATCLVAGLAITILVLTGFREAIGVNVASSGRAFPTPGQAVIPAQVVGVPDFFALCAGSCGRSRSETWRRDSPRS